MKFIVKKTIKDTCYYGGRNSDGSFWNSITQTNIYVFSDTELELVSIAKIIQSFIKYHEGEKKWLDCGHFESTYDEFLSDELSKELVSMLKKVVDNVEVGDESCKILINVNYLLDYQERKQWELYRYVAEINSQLKKEIFDIEIKALKDKELFIANSVLDCYFNNPNSYLANEKILGHNLLDCVMTTNNIPVLNDLISKGFTEVDDKERFSIWLCSVNKFDYLQLFCKDEELLYKGKKGDLLFRAIIYYAILFENLDVLRKYLVENISKQTQQYFKRLFDYFSLDGIEHSFDKKNVSIHTLALSIGTLKIIIFFKEEIPELNAFEFRFNNIYDIRNLDKIYLSYCFKNIEFARYFIDENPTKAVSSILYHKKYELLYELIKENFFQNRKVDLNIFEQYLDEIDVEVIVYFASNYLLNSEDLYKILKKSLKTNSYELFEKLFSKVRDNNEITKENIFRLLYLLTYNDYNLDNIKVYINYLFNLVKSDDYMELFCIGVLGNNFTFVKLFLPFIKDINSSFNLKYHKIFSDFFLYDISFDITNEGTLLHLLVKLLELRPNAIYNSNRVKMIIFLINFGLDISKKNNIGKTAAESINHKSDIEILLNKDVFDFSHIVDLIYVDGVKICSSTGSLFWAYRNSELPIVKKFKSYLLEGNDLISVYKSKQVDILNFYLKCGAELSSLKKLEQIQDENKQLIPKKDVTKSTSFYSRKELDDMYCDAFDGDPDATWNVD